jgi:hypothetical protein
MFSKEKFFLKKCDPNRKDVKEWEFEDDNSLISMLETLAIIDSEDNFSSSIRNLYYPNIAFAFSNGRVFEEIIKAFEGVCEKITSSYEPPEKPAPEPPVAPPAGAPPVPKTESEDEATERKKKGKSGRI